MFCVCEIIYSSHVQLFVDQDALMPSLKVKKQQAVELLFLKVVQIPSLNVKKHPPVELLYFFF